MSVEQRPAEQLGEPLLPCGNCGATMQRLALAGHYGHRVELDLCPACDMVWFDLTETAQLSGTALLELIGHMARSHTQAHTPLRPDAACPRCKGALRFAHNQSRWGRSSQLMCARRHGAYQSFAQFLQEKGLLRPMSRLDRGRLLRDRGRIDCVNCGAGLALDDALCTYCGSVPSLLDVARLARALDPEEALDPHPVHATPQRHGALQCAACGAAFPPGQSVTCASCGATLAVTSLAEANASVQALGPALRAAARRPPPALVKRRLEALDADLPRRRAWVAGMQSEAGEGGESGPESGWTSLGGRAPGSLRSALEALVRRLVWWK